MSKISEVLGGIRKAVVAGAGALVTGGVAVLTADNWDISTITQSQSSTVIALALAAGVGTFAIPNKFKPAVDAAEKVIADKGGQLVVDKAIPGIEQFVTKADLTGIFGDFQTAVAGMASLTLPSNEDVDSGAALVADVPSSGAHAAPSV